LTEVNKHLTLVLVRCNNAVNNAIQEEVMARCPNRSRKKAGLGGGHPGCEGSVELVLQVPVVLTLKRIPRGSDGFEELATSNVRKYGKRVQPETLERMVHQGKYDCVCSLCGWSLNKAVAQVSKSKGRK
jgi:hypothetical protein